MTRYTVLRDNALKQHFVDAWVRSDSDTRNVLTDVANWIDEELSVEPEAKGRPDVGQDNLRILAVANSMAQISIAYHVLPEDRKVIVVRLLFRRQSK
ncbi:MAG TPA: hypothetical protein P5307_17575 [Pirellulaceae bacterium]|nr:hypothetical protein [Planctomycetales bacterium]MCB9937335.1 hypothetical protein [Planctomycetaceae bacterium]HRX80886.1 hypothetical protein [Pirellulaceae bacterium]